MRRSILAMCVLGLMGCSSTPTPPEATPSGKQTSAFKTEVSTTAKVPKRIILFIGDGMGIPQVTAAAYANGGPLNMMKMPHYAWLTTHEYEYAATDSAASATAFATGHKTHYTGVSVKPGTTAETQSDPNTHLKTIMEWANELDLGTGLVATTRIVHATPAAFAAHRATRNDYEGVALDMSKANIDVLMGAGTQYFTQRADGLNLLDVMVKDHDYTYVADPSQLPNTEAKRLLALFHEKDMPYILDGGRAMSLNEMTNQAIAQLDRTHPEGFVLMVEGSFIDWCGHDLDAKCVVAETLDFDDTIGSALKYASGRDDTLVVVTADHETGGLSIMDPYYAERFSTVLGGEAAMTAATALKDPSFGHSAPPIEHFAIGARSAKPSPAAIPKPPEWGMIELADARFTAAWGHLSIASRPLFEGHRRFYGAHTVTMVPMFAQGPGAEYLSTVRDNADLGKALINLVKSRRNNAPKFNTANPEPVRPKNVVLMIGDGMGVNALTTATYLYGDTNISALPVQGFASTHSIDAVVNDSAAGATALATGKRTRKRTAGMVVQDATLVPGTSIIDYAEGHGIKTGIVTTTQLTHATPASFYADVDHRRKKWDIAKDFVSFKRRTAMSNGIDVVVAGGGADFDEAMRGELRKDGYTFKDAWDPSPVDGNVVMLVSDQGLPNAIERKASGMTLAAIARYALDHLAKGHDPFFLMIEGGQIDWELHHAKRDASVPSEVEDFDDAVAVVADFARQHGDTLLIVTADHDHSISAVDTHYPFAQKMCAAEKACGGSYEAIRLPVATEGIRHGEGLKDSSLQGVYTPSELILQYAWLVQEGMQKGDLDAPHSANLVPVFALGPWATELRGMTDQPDIGGLIHRWAKEK